MFSIFSSKAVYKWWDVVCYTIKRLAKVQHCFSSSYHRLHTAFSRQSENWKVWVPVYHAWNKKTRLLRSLTSSSVSLGSEEPVLWPSTETSHFRAMIRALLWGRYSTIVAEYQYNGLAPDLTHWCGRVHAAAPHCNPLHERTHSDLIALSVFVQLFICVHVR